MTAAVITGGTGAIGLALARLLLERDYNVYVLCRKDSPRLGFLPDSAKLHILDCGLTALAEAEKKIAEPCAFFFHLGWHASYGAERADAHGQTRNVLFSLDAVRLAARLGCEVFVGAGSQAQYGDTDALLTEATPLRPETAYGAAKLCAEHMTRLLCRDLGLRQVWARILSVYGPGDGPYTLVTYLVRSLLRDEEAVLTPCEQEWDFLFAEDAARALLALAENSQAEGPFCLASGTHRPLREYIEDFCAASGNKARVRIGGKPYAPGQRQRLGADTAALKAATGFKPGISFREGMTRTIDWYKAHPEGLGGDDKEKACVS